MRMYISTLPVICRRVKDQFEILPLANFNSFLSIHIISTSQDARNYIILCYIIFLISDKFAYNALKVSGGVAE